MRCRHYVGVSNAGKSPNPHRSPHYDSNHDINLPSLHSPERERITASHGSGRGSQAGRGEAVHLSAHMRSPFSNDAIALAAHERQLCVHDRTVQHRGAQLPADAGQPQRLVARQLLQDAVQHPLRKLQQRRIGHRLWVQWVLVQVAQPAYRDAVRGAVKAHRLANDSQRQCWTYMNTCRTKPLSAPLSGVVCKGDRSKELLRIASTETSYDRVTSCPDANSWRGHSHHGHRHLATWCRVQRAAVQRARTVSTCGCFLDCERLRKRGRRMLAGGWVAYETSCDRWSWTQARGPFGAESTRLLLLSPTVARAPAFRNPACGTLAVAGNCSLPQMCSGQVTRMNTRR